MSASKIELSHSRSLFALPTYLGLVTLIGAVDEAVDNGGLGG
jgi:hypothetical protein